MIFGNLLKYQEIMAILIVQLVHACMHQIKQFTKLTLNALFTLRTHMNLSNVFACEMKGPRKPDQYCSVKSGLLQFVYVVVL